MTDRSTETLIKAIQWRLDQQPTLDYIVLPRDWIKQALAILAAHSGEEPTEPPVLCDGDFLHGEYHIRCTLLEGHSEPHRLSSGPRQIEPPSGDKSQTFACTICGLQVSGGQVSFDQMSKEQKDLA